MSTNFKIIQIRNHSFCVSIQNEYGTVDVTVYSVYVDEILASGDKQLSCNPQLQPPIPLTMQSYKYY